jgi:hypothetical protein
MGKRRKSPYFFISDGNRYMEKTDVYYGGLKWSYLGIY